MHALAVFITDFGDTAVTVPLAAVTIVLLVMMRRPRLALAWGIGIVGCAGTIAAFKLVLAGCSHRIAIPDVISPSGHAAMSTAVYGGLALLLGGALTPFLRRAAYAGTALLVAAIAATRVVLHDHTPPEVAIGLAVGLAALAICGALLAAARPQRLSVGRFLVAAAVTIAVMHGTRWPAERAIRGLAHSVLLHDVVPWCR